MKIDFGDLQIPFKRKGEKVFVIKIRMTFEEFGKLLGKIFRRKKCQK